MTTEDEQTIDYTKYLNQSLVWPSYDNNENLRILDMHVAHAIRAYRKLNRECVESYQSKLSMALLKQAIGEEVVYAADVKTCKRVHHADQQYGLKQCYDISAAMTVAGTMHPIDAAQLLMKLLHS
jgi:hypothetical protein